MDSHSTLSARRTLLKRAAAVSALAATALSAPPAVAAVRPAAVPLAACRLTLPSGISTGDVSSDFAVLWSRASAPAACTLPFAWSTPTAVCCVDATAAPCTINANGKVQYTRTSTPQR